MIVIGSRVVNLATGSFCGSDNFHGTLASLEGKVPPRAIPPSLPLILSSVRITAWMLIIKRANNEIILLSAAREPAHFLEKLFQPGPREKRLY